MHGQTSGHLPLSLPAWHMLPSVHFILAFAYYAIRIYIQSHDGLHTVSRRLAFYPTAVG